MQFSGTVTSDFLKYVTSDITDKDRLIDYSAGDWTTFRDSLLAYAKAVYPLDFNNFTESDFGIMLIELMATVGHIQSIKSDYLANENFLKTARSRSSVKKLLELIGVRMKGPIAAAANAKITVNSVSPSGSTLTVQGSNRVVTISSPLDGESVSYTLYKVNSDGSIDLTSNTVDLIFNASYSNANTVVQTDAILLEGALVVEEGTFTSPESIKTISLSQRPYIEKSAQVFIEGNPTTQGIYTEEENVYFASGLDDKVFQIATDDTFAAKVIFGDASFGKSPSVGDRYTITYRIGGGERGNMQKEALNAPLTVSIGGNDYTATLENSSESTGGAEAETIVHAKRYAPYTFRRQDRLVTLADYKSFANSFISAYGSTGKANAVVRRAYSSANIIDLFVLERATTNQLKKATPEYKRQLLLAMSEKKMLTDEPVVVDGLIRTLDLFVTLKCDKRYQKKSEEIIAKARARILDYFNIDNGDFGLSFNPQDLVRDLTNLIEVRYSTVDNVESPIHVEFNEIIQLNNLTINVSYI